MHSGRTVLKNQFRKDCVKESVKEGLCLKECIQEGLFFIEFQDGLGWKGS